MLCFATLFLGYTSDKVSSLFRAIGAHYVDHFTLVVLHGMCYNDNDPDFRVGNLYGVFHARKCSFKGRSLYTNGKKKDYLNFSETIGRFCKTEFPETFAQWEETVQKDGAVRKMKMKMRPKFVNASGLTVMYSTTSNAEKLRGPFASSLTTDEDILKKYNMRVANFNGCLLSKLSQCGRKDNIAVVVAIKDTCDGWHLPHLQDAIKMTITHFIRAVIVAGLPSGKIQYMNILYVLFL